MDLTEIEKAAPSARLAKRLEGSKAYEGEHSKLDEQQATCVGFSVSQAGFCLEQALREATTALARLDPRPELAGVRASLASLQYWTEIGLNEAKDAAFVLDGYHDWYKQDRAWEVEVSEDLDICGYAGKWKSAKESVAREKPSLNGSAYWDAVRTYFLELGGCYLSERCEHSNQGTADSHWQVAISQAIATRPIEPFTQVRQG